jgi:GNAT superfamily N-acetyltransferase
MPTPEHYVFSETLRDGTIVTVRAARADDRERIRRAFRNLEPETVYTRFFEYKSDVSDAELARITGADFESSGALLVTIGVHEDEVIIGGASFFVVGTPASDGRSAELAFTVEEDFQGRGIASLLMRHIIAIARARDIVQLEADVLSQNVPMLNVFRGCGLPCRMKNEGGVVHAVLSLREAR